MGFLDIFNKKNNKEENVEVAKEDNKTIENNISSFDVMMEHDKKLKDIMSSSDAQKVNNFGRKYMESLEEEKRQNQLREQEAEAERLKNEKLKLDEEIKKLDEENCKKATQDLENHKKLLENLSNNIISKDILEQIIETCRHVWERVNLEIVAVHSPNLMDILVKDNEVLESIIDNAKKMKHELEEVSVNDVIIDNDGNSMGTTNYEDITNKTR